MAWGGRCNREFETPIKSFADCKQLRQSRPRKRKLANGTYIADDGDSYAIELYGTPIVTFHPDDSITVGATDANHRDWLYSQTTKARMLCCGVGVWRMPPSAIIHWRGHQWGYKAGMRLWPDGRSQGSITTEAAKAQHAERNRLMRRESNELLFWNKSKLTHLGEWMVGTHQETNKVTYLWHWHGNGEPEVQERGRHPWKWRNAFVPNAEAWVRVKHSKCPHCGVKAEGGLRMAGMLNSVDLGV